MSRERRITFRCNLDEADKLFDLLYRIAQATWSAYEREFTEPLYWDSFDEYEAHLEQLDQDRSHPYPDDDIPF